VHVDVHQHLWPELLVAELRRRSQPPRLDGWTLLTSGEPPFTVNPADHDPVLRAAQAARDGAGRVIIGLSSPLGIEYLAPGEAEPLLDAYHRGAAGLGAPFTGWAAACLTEIDPGGLAKQLDRGLAGLQLPATALADEAGYRWCGPLLEVLADRALPLFVHPGPATLPWGDTVSPRGQSPGGHGQQPSAGGAAGGPPWWAALVPYVQQLHAAWFAFRAYGRPAFPGLRVCFAALAGLAPLHGERLAARGGGDPMARGVVDPGAFVETSSYGDRAVDSVVRVLGVDMIVFGSDRPYAQPHPDHGLGDAARHAISVTNPARLLDGDCAAAGGGT
jgi:6-methylsalicylate decarboxylase